MNQPQTDIRKLVQAGLAALQAGDAKRARVEFDRVIATGRADASVHLAMAAACRADHDPDGALAAVDRALQLDPRHMMALIFKADELANAGNMRSAAAHYQQAVQQARAGARLAPEIQREVDRAAAISERFADDAEARVRGSLAKAGVTGGHGDSRFDASIDIMFGRRKIYTQQPRYYFFPELPQRQFFDRSEFPWLDRVEAATDDICAEVLEVMRESAAFQPYVQDNPERPPREQVGLLNNPAWSAFYLWKDGELVAENAPRCPKTLAALEGLPICRTTFRSPSIFFSLLRPGAHIPPHHGMVNTRLLCHLPLIVPAGCRLRVGNETREWVKGKAWLFDDTIEHEAWNDSAETRVILIFEVWRPELSEQERVQVAGLFDAIDSDRGVRPKWEV